MPSLRRSRRRAAVRWTDLPSGPLSAIAAHLQNPLDITRFRSVCRSWRLSISPPPPNKISPLRPPLDPEFEPLSNHLIAGAVYLLRHHANPSQAWITSVQESNLGKLFLRQPLTYEPIPRSSKYIIDLSEWRVTQIAVSYIFRIASGYKCSHCRHTRERTQVVFVSNSDVSEAIDMALYDHYKSGCCVEMDAFRLSLSDHSDVSKQVFVKFDGRMYVVDEEAQVYVLDDSAALQILPMNCVNLPNLYYSLNAKRSKWRFMVSDGDLYLVVKVWKWLGINGPECRVYKLVMDGTDAMSYNLERVEDLGDRVFFINKNCSFSVSARDLPRDLEGNCVVFGRNPYDDLCERFTDRQEFDVFHLGHEQKEYKSKLYEVYSALFTPPSLWIQQLQRVYSEEEVKKSSFRRGRSRRYSDRLRKRAAASNGLCCPRKSSFTSDGGRIWRFSD